MRSGAKLGTPLLPVLKGVSFGIEMPFGKQKQVVADTRPSDLVPAVHAARRKDFCHAIELVPSRYRGQPLAAR
jgi:hypothetical protein